MENLKKHLLEKGYVTFNIKDVFPNLIHNLEFVKNKTLNINPWRLYISAVMSDAEHKDFELWLIENVGNQVDWESRRYHKTQLNQVGYEIEINCPSWDVADEIQNKINKDIIHTTQQYWFQQPYWVIDEEGDDFIRNSVEIFDRVFSVFYDGSYSKDSNSKFALTNFRNGCHIHRHTDGQNPERVCGMLFYLNPDFNKDTGGCLILDDVEVPAEFGNVTILDYTKNNLPHEVSQITENKNRFTLIKFFERNVRPI